MLAAVTLIVSNCSKSSGYPRTLFHDPLTHGDWKLLRSDTTLYDSAYNVTGHHSADVSTCAQQKHMIFLRNQEWERYVGCARPSDIMPGGTWAVDGNFLVMYPLSSPRGQPSYKGIDSIELCNWDSLVVFERVRPYDIYSSFLYNVPATVHSWWGH